MTEQQAIELWKELGVTNVNFEFSCGGDSMNDTQIVIEAKEGVVKNDELESYFDNETYKKVEFYVNSDGHYQGEAGTVYITLDEDDEEPYFMYSKSSRSEWSEQFTNQVLVPLTDEEIAFINENVLNFNGSSDEDTLTVYKRDIFLTDEDEKLIAAIEAKIDVAMGNHVALTDEGDDISDWYSYNTTENNLTINENKELVVEYNSTVTVYSEDDN